MIGFFVFGIYGFRIENFGFEIYGFGIENFGFGIQNSGFMPRVTPKHGAPLLAILPVAHLVRSVPPLRLIKVQPTPIDSNSAPC
jgi:hypothetical protein